MSSQRDKAFQELLKETAQDKVKDKGIEAISNGFGIIVTGVVTTFIPGLGGLSTPISKLTTFAAEISLTALIKFAQQNRKAATQYDFSVRPGGIWEGKARHPEVATLIGLPAETEFKPSELFKEIRSPKLPASSYFDSSLLPYDLGNMKFQNDPLFRYEILQRIQTPQGLEEVGWLDLWEARQNPPECYEAAAPVFSGDTILDTYFILGKHQPSMSARFLEPQAKLIHIDGEVRIYNSGNDYMPASHRCYFSEVCKNWDPSNKKCHKFY